MKYICNNCDYIADEEDLRYYEDPDAYGPYYSAIQTECSCGGRFEVYDE